MKLTKVALKGQAQKGFTLIELMITVAIVGILAAVALPAYQDYTIRAQASEGMQLSGGVQTAISEYYANKGAFPASLTDINMVAPTGKYVSGITEANGIVTVTYGVNSNTKISGKTVDIAASDDGNGNIQWKCGPGASTPIDKKYLPSSCQGV